MATETVANILTSMGYDLRDASSLQYPSAERLEYLNRALRALDAFLSSLKSGWVSDEDTSVTLSQAANSATKPTGTIVVREVWIGSDQLYKKDHDVIYYKRQFISGTGQPDYFAEEGTSLIFERTADQDYTLEIYRDQRATALTAVGNMPYDDEFNDPLREAAVILAKRRNEHDVNLDALLHDFFMQAAITKEMRRKFKPKRYRLGF
jgi:hypothetical protein